MGIVTRIDFSVLNSVQDFFRCTFLDYIMPIITVLGDHGIIPILIALALLIVKKTRKIGLSMAFSFIYGGLFGNLILKNLFARLRPYEAVYTESILHESDLLISGLSDYSFPSGHTLILFELAVVLLILLKRKGKIISISSLVIAFLVAFSRLYLYVHFPSDVFAGMILGTLFGFMGVATSTYLLRYVENNKDKT